MKYAIISDIHSNLEAFQAVLEYIRNLGTIDRILCCGDIVGYYADPKSCIALMRAEKINSVVGNHDLAVCTDHHLCDWKVAVDAAIWTKNNLSDDEKHYLRKLPFRKRTGSILLFHGALHLRDDIAATDLHLEKEEDIILSFGALKELDESRVGNLKVGFFGHTHKPVIYQYNDGVLSTLREPEEEVHLDNTSHYLINPGSVGQARDTPDKRASFLTYDTSKEVVKFHKVEYDRKTTLKKAKAQGLLEKPLIHRYGKRLVNKIRSILHVT